MPEEHSFRLSERPEGRTCAETREAISASLDTEVDSAERAAVEAHLAGCATCRQERDALEAADRLVAAYRVGPAPVHLRERVEREWDRHADDAGGDGPRRRYRVIWIALGLLGLLVAILVAVGVGGVPVAVVGITVFAAAAVAAWRASP